MAKKAPLPPILILFKASLILKLIYRVIHILIRSYSFWTFNMNDPV